MDIDDLRTFIVLAETKNFTRTSRQLYIAQSTVTNRISELEAEMHVSLFLRTKRSVELTDEGEQFLSYAKKMVELADSSLANISSKKRFEEHVRIGSADSLYEAYLSVFVQKYHKQHPNSALQVSIGTSTKLIEQLSTDIYDAVFSYLPVSDKKYFCDVFRQDEMVLVTDAGNSEYADGIRKDELMRVNYIMCNFALQDVGQFIRGIFPRYHMFSLEIDDCSKIIPYLIGEDTYTFLPKEMAERYLEAGTLRAIPLLDIKTPVLRSYIIGKKSKETVINDIFERKTVNII